jgi:Predicted endonuclease distantly related to archaeal Holliday junction resolvase
MQVRGKRAFGQLGEDKACAFLEAQGHRIVARNWRGSHLEVDIISEDADGLHFVEVKTRLDADATPEEKVDALKQRRISAAALKYLNETGSDRERVLRRGLRDPLRRRIDGELLPQAWIPMYL